MNSETLQKEQSLQHKLKIYEDHQRLKKCIAIEHKINQKNEKTKQNTKKLQEFEFKISELKQENLINKELLKLNRHLDGQERKFRAIQKATNSSTIEDVLPYYLYLKTNKANLEKTLKESLALISNLSAEKKNLVNEFNVFKYQYKENIEKIDVATMENNLKTKEEELKNNENDLERLEMLVLFAVNTLSRVSFQLSEDKNIEVTRNNIPFTLGYICIKIEKIFNVIQNYQNVYYIESINTDIHYNSLPKFLKLLPSFGKLPGNIILID